ncbi:MAG: ferrochelatase [Actinomycetaceae bacterium]|nr:ferrochelatase [Actinomycetaceae bacterium]
MTRITTDLLAPYDAVLMCAYGGPDGPSAVLPFMRNATKGKGVPDERLMEVSTHYDRYGGLSPIIARNQDLKNALEKELAERGCSIPVYIGNRNWHPYFVDTLRRMIHAGHRRILMMTTSAYASYSGCRQYREDVWNARQELIDEGVIGASELVIERSPIYYNQPGFVQANAKAVQRAWESLVKRGYDRPLVLFVTHSIPIGMQQASGTEGHDYVAQHEEHIAKLIESLPGTIHSAGNPMDYELVYCSRSGPPQAPWLEPDVNDAIEEAAERGVKAVLTVPIGFIQDHMEVVHDLDHEAAETAQEAGLGFARADTAGIDPVFVSMLVDLLAGRAQAAREGLAPEKTGLEWHDDHDNCCAIYPGAALPAAISQQQPKEATMTNKHGHPGKQAGGHPDGHPGGHPGGNLHAHPTGHQPGPADPRDHAVDPDEVNAQDHFFLYAVFGDKRGYEVADAQALAQEIEEAIAETGSTVRGFYDIEGFKPNADLLIWFYADSAAKVQDAYRAVRRSRLGEFLVPEWNAMSAHIPAEFDARHLPACIDGVAPRDWVAVYPFVRTLDWYYLNPARRQAMLREHGMNGRDYLDVKVSTLAAFALSDYEWTLALEADTLDRIMGVLRKQREVEARVYTRIDTPFYTGRRVSLKEWIER